VAAAVFAIVVFGCAQEGAEQAQQMEMAATVDMAALEAVMDEIRGTWEQTYEAGDVAGVAALYATDAIYMAPYAEARNGRAAIEQAFTENMAMMANRAVEIIGTDQGVSGDLAYEIGTYAQTAEVEGQPYEDFGKYLVVSKRQADGSWKIVAHIFNTNLPREMPGAMMEGEM
jgi:uncharacterized protein (TIGR02246 family)